MLKILFGLLLLVNGGLFAYQQGYLDSLSPSTREPSRLSRELNADKLSLMVPTPDDAPAVAVTPAIAVPDKVDEKPAPVVEKVVVLACTEIGNFDPAEARRFETQLAALALGNRLKRRPVAETTRHMVYIPPLGSKEAADRRAAELKAMGVTDFFVIQDAPQQWGISLGIFKSEEAARNQLVALTQKGVRNVRLSTHSPASGKVAFQLLALDAATKSGLDRIKGNFPRQESRACVAPVAG